MAAMAKAEGRRTKLVGAVEVQVKARPVSMQQPVEIAAFSKGRDEDAFDEEGRKNLVRGEFGRERDVQAMKKRCPEGSGDDVTIP